MAKVFRSYARIVSDAEKGNYVTKETLAKSLLSKSKGQYDYAIPATWVDKVQARMPETHQDVTYHFVWWYPDEGPGHYGGVPYPLDDKGIEILTILGAGI